MITCMKKKTSKKTKKPIKVSKKETTHEVWLNGYWKWRKQQQTIS